MKKRNHYDVLALHENRISRNWFDTNMNANHGGQILPYNKIKSYI